MSQALPAPKQLNLNKLSDAGGFKFSGCPTQPKTDFRGRFGIGKGIINRCQKRGSYEKKSKRSGLWKVDGTWPMPSVKQLTTIKNTTFVAKDVWTALKRTLKNIQNNE